ncbi:MAG: hypothetical protein ACI396_10485, partial [Acutalibacteraceae bacterium]
KGFNDRNTYISKTEYMLFTRATSLEKLKLHDCSNFRIFMMKDAVIDGESAISEEVYNNDSEVSENIPQAQQQDIHAKMYMVLKNSDSYLYLGSLNASHNAVSGNVEFMIMLKSKKGRLNMSKLAQSLFNGVEDNPTNPFCEAHLSDTIIPDDEHDKTNLLNDYIKEIIRLNPYANACANDDKYDLSITFPEFEKSEYDAHISPLLANKTEKLKGEVSFTDLTAAQLSTFYKISVSDGERTVQRILIIPTNGLPEDREKAVISSIVNNRECFYSYIALLLGDSVAFSALEASSEIKAAKTVGGHNLAHFPALYEKLLQTAATDPERFDEIDYLIKAISADGVIPEQFDELYNTIKRAVNRK